MIQVELENQKEKNAWTGDELSTIQAFEVTLKPKSSVFICVICVKAVPVVPSVIRQIRAQTTLMLRNR
jgi:hypothetical protein